MNDPREALARLLYDHAKTGRSCIGRTGCPDAEFMNGHQHAEHVAELISREFLVVPRIEKAPLPQCQQTYLVVLDSGREVMYQCERLDGHDSGHRADPGDPDSVMTVKWSEPRDGSQGVTPDGT